MKKFTILLIDDIESNLYVLKLIIQSNFKDIEILTASGSYEAINIITHQNIDLILSDVQMPGLSGIELASYVNTNKRDKEIPIILISAMYTSKRIIQEGYNAGIVDYITKPIDDDLLCSKLAVFIKIYNERKNYQHTINQLEQESIVQDKFSNLNTYCDLIDMDDCLIDLSNVNALKKHSII